MAVIVRLNVGPSPFALAEARRDRGALAGYGVLGAEHETGAYAWIEWLEDDRRQHDGFYPKRYIHVVGTSFVGGF